MKDLSLSKGLLDSVTSVLKDSSKAVAEQSKAAASRLNDSYAKTIARPLSQVDAKVAAMESRAPNKRVYDSISQVYSKSVAEAQAQAKVDAEAIQKAYGKLGASKPITEEKKVTGKKSDIITDPAHPDTLKARKAKAQADVDEAKSHTVPETDKEKKLAALAKPKDKITHKDVLVGRGVVKEETPAKNTDVADKSYLKTAGKKPGPLHNVAKGLKAFIQGKQEPMESVEQPAGEEIIEATHIISGDTDFMKKNAKAEIEKVGGKISKVVDDEDSGTSEYHVQHDQRNRIVHASEKLSKKADKQDKEFGGLVTQEEVTLSQDEIARIAKLAQEFDSKE